MVTKQGTAAEENIKMSKVWYICALRYTLKESCVSLALYMSKGFIPLGRTKTTRYHARKGTATHGKPKATHTHTPGCGSRGAVRRGLFYEYNLSTPPPKQDVPSNTSSLHTFWRRPPLSTEKLATERRTYVCSIAQRGFQVKELLHRTLLPPHTPL